MIPCRVRKTDSKNHINKLIQIKINFKLFNIKKMQQQRRQSNRVMILGRGVRDICTNHSDVNTNNINNQKIVIQYNNQQGRQNSFRMKKEETENCNIDSGLLDTKQQGLLQHCSPEFKEPLLHKRTISLYTPSGQQNQLRVLQRSNGININIKKEIPRQNQKQFFHQYEKQNAVSQLKIWDKTNGKMNFQSPEKMGSFTHRNPSRNQSISKDQRGCSTEIKNILIFQKKQTIISGGKQKIEHQRKNGESILYSQQNFNLPLRNQNQTIVRTHPIMEVGSLKQIKIQFRRGQKQNCNYKIDTTEKSQTSLQEMSTNEMASSKDFKIQDFIVGALLGKGKFGQVFLTKHKETGFVCALKKIKKSTIREEKLEHQLIRELKIQSYLHDPNIVNLYGFFSDEESVYILLELCSGGELYKLLRKKRRLQQEFTAYIIKQVCQATRYLHNNYVIHRDIKPQNIIFQNGVVKLCDFGWAVSCHDELRKTLCGTPLYFSPQIIKGDEYDYSTDIWTIGVLTYELLIGSNPFKIWSEMELNKIIDNKVQFPTWVDLSDASKDFILKLLTKNPKDRISLQQVINHPFLLSSKQSIKNFF